MNPSGSNSMQILILSDIHGNSVALEKILTHAPAYQAVWCLGDVVGYGPAPNECVARLRGLDALCLSGNHDLAALGKLPLKEFSENARTSLAWTRKALTPENSAWLASKNAKEVVSEFSITLVHASPRDPVWEYIGNAQAAAENMPYFDTPVCLFGHTHNPIAYMLREQERILRAESLRERAPYPLQPKVLLNVGSAGQPRDGDPRAAYAILDTDRQTITPYRSEYNIQATQRAIHNAGLPYRLAERLAYGN